MAQESCGIAQVLVHGVTAAVVAPFVAVGLRTIADGIHRRTINLMHSIRELVPEALLGGSIEGMLVTIVICTIEKLTAS